MPGSSSDNVEADEIDKLLVQLDYAAAEWQRDREVQTGRKGVSLYHSAAATIRQLRTKSQ